MDLPGGPARCRTGLWGENPIQSLPRAAEGRLRTSPTITKTSFRAGQGLGRFRGVPWQAGRTPAGIGHNRTWWSTTPPKEHQCFSNALTFTSFALIFSFYNLSTSSISLTTFPVLLSHSVYSITGPPFLPLCPIPHHSSPPLPPQQYLFSFTYPPL